MTAALKDKPAIPFRIPPGIRLVRVDLATGQLPPPGDKNVIYEAFKPGTEPTSDAAASGLLRGPISDDEDAASLGPPSEDATDSASANPVPSAAGATPAVAPSGLPAPHSVPASGTGGLY